MAVGRVVFIVDRDQAVRDSLRFDIELDGLDVRTCGTARELLAHPEIGNGGCAVIDGGTLERDDPDIVTRLEAACEVLPVVLIVDPMSWRRLARSLSAGLFHVVEKPVLDDALLRCVRTVLRTEM